jgi:hypothetical protein
MTTEKGHFGKHSFPRPSKLAAPAPGTYINIVSKAKDPDGRSLAIADGGYNVIVDALSETSDSQLWERRAFPDGSYALVNKASNMCIARQYPGNGSPLQPMPVSVLPNPLAQWRDDNVSGPYNAINSLQDWEQKINIPGDGPYYEGQPLITYKWSGGADNELWEQVPSKAPVYTLKTIDFDTTKAQRQSLAAVGTGSPTGSSQPIELVNDARISVVMPIATDVIVYSQYGFQPATGAPNFAMAYSGVRPTIDGSGAIALVQGDWQYGPTTYVNTPAHFSGKVNVPPSVTAGYWIMEGPTQLTVPYTALFAPLSGSGDPITVNGVYTAACPGPCYAYLGATWPP